MAAEHTFICDIEGTLETRIISSIKAIRRKCLECSNFSVSEIAKCEIEHCPLWVFRFGKDPGRTKRVLSPERRAELAKQLSMGRKKAA